MAAKAARAVRDTRAGNKRRQWIPHKPWPKQQAFLAWGLDAYGTDPDTGETISIPTEALYGGAAGGGKSDAILMGALQFVDVPGYSSLILRRTYPELQRAGGLMDRAHEWLSGTDAKWNGQYHEWRFPSGAKLAFSHLDNPNDKHKHRSSEYQYIGFDELTTFPKGPYRFLFSRLRANKSICLPDGRPIPLRMRSGSNPGGIGHQWVKDRFVLRKRDREDTDEQFRWRWFLPAFVQDNPALSAASYIRSLGYLGRVEKAQLVKGDWDVEDDKLITSAEIDVCTVHPCLWEDGAPKRQDSELYLGVDVGRSGDLFSILTLELVGDTFWTREYQAFTGQKYEVMEKVIHDRMADKRYVKCCIDKGGIGNQLAERMADRYGESRCEGVALSQGRQGQLGAAVKADMGNAKIRIPNDAVLREDIQLVRKIGTGVHGDVTIKTDRAELDDEQRSHADRFWALALARYAAGILPTRTDPEWGGAGYNPDYGSGWGNE